MNQKVLCFLCVFLAPQIVKSVTIGIGSPTISNGVITSISVVSGGSGFNLPPIVSVTDEGGGSGATASANTSGGVVTSVTMISGGSAYSANTKVYFLPSTDDVGTNPDDPDEDLPDNPDDGNSSDVNYAFAPSLIDVNENIQEGSPIGTISVTSENETFEPISVSLVSGEGDTDNTLFSIDGNQLLLSVSPNYELKPGYFIRIKAIMQDDSVLEDHIFIRVVDINEVPTGIDLKISSISETALVNSSIATISLIDPDIGQSNGSDFQLVDGEGSRSNSFFSITNNQLNLISPLDFEIEDELSIRIKGVDVGGLAVEEVLNISILDANEPPSCIEIDNSFVSENVDYGYPVGKLSLVDPDNIDNSSRSPDHIHIIAYIDGRDTFEISNESIVIHRETFGWVDQTLTINGYPWYVEFPNGTSPGNSSSLYVEKNYGIIDGEVSLQVHRARSGVQITQQPSIENNQTIMVQFNDSGLGGNDLYEISINGLKATSFTFENGVGGEDNSLFSINGSDLVLNDNPNYERKSSYSVRIKGYDTEGQSVVNELTVNVTDVNEHPVLAEIGNREIKVSTPTSINLSSTDEDGDSLFYAAVIRSGNIETEISNSMLHIIPESNWSGLASISVTVFDGKGGLDTETFELLVYKDYFIDATKLELESTLSLNPSDPVANYHYIFWELADLLESTKFKSMLNILGFSSDIFALTVDSVQEDGSLDNIEFSLNAEFQLEELRSYMLDDVIPKLDSLEARFATIGQDDVIQLYDDSEFDEQIFVDYADSLVFRALSKFLTCLIRIELAYGHYDIQTKEIAEMYHSGILTTEYLRDKYPEYGSVYDVSILQTASIDLKNAINFYQEASPLLRSSNRTQGLFLLEQEDYSGEQEFSENLSKLEFTLDGQHPWGDNVADIVFIDLQPFFNGQVDFSKLLPQSYGNLYRDSSFADSTFGGTFPAMSDTRSRDYFLEAGLFTDNIWLGTKPMNDRYWWETNGHWWRSHWFGMFYRENPDWWHQYEERIFPTNWMFHLWLGWIYPAVATPESIWIWQENSESWLWTNKELFPILYSHTSGLWFYVSQEDGSQYIWLNGEWVFFK